MSKKQNADAAEENSPQNSDDMVLNEMNLDQFQLLKGFAKHVHPNQG